MQRLTPIAIHKERFARPEARPRSLALVFTLSMIPLSNPPRGTRERRAGLTTNPAHVTVLWLLPTDLCDNHPPGTRNPGGGRRDRTDDLLLAKQALSRLSYAPERLQTPRLMTGGPGRI